MIDIDADQNEDFSAAKDLICDIETHSNLETGTKYAQNNSEQQAVVSKNSSTMYKSSSKDLLQTYRNPMKR